MLEKLQIRNFQAHEKLTIAFGVGVTAIVGESDVGKSSVLRALRWVCCNQPMGTAFVRSGSDGAAVRLTFDGGQKITRTRGGDTNTYEYKDACAEDKKFCAFGAAVPGEIESSLNLAAESYQGQHDSPFWLSQTAGDVSRQLNAVVDLGVVDSALTNIKRVATEAKGLHAASLAAAEAAGVAVAGWEWAESCGDAFARVDRVASRAAEVVGRVAKLREACAWVRRAQKHAETSLGRAEALGAVVVAAKAARAADERLGRLRGILVAASRWKAVASVDLPDTSAVDESLRIAALARTRHSDLLAVVDSAGELTASAGEVASRAAAARRELTAAVSLGCPICGSVAT